MNLAVFLVLLLQTAVVLAIALAACVAAKSTPAIRLAICRVCLLTVVGLLVWRPWTQLRPSPVVPIEFNYPAASAQVTRAPASAVHVHATPAVAGKAESVKAQAAPTSFSTEGVAAVVWAAGSAVLTLNLVLGVVALGGLRRRCKPLWDPRALSTVETLAKRVRIRTPRMMECPEELGLFVAGAVRPTIFAPASLLSSLSDEDLEAVLDHEIAHVANGDLVWGLIRRLITIALWWQPLVWLLRRPMETASEELCDRHVLATGVSQNRYAECLLGLQERFGKHAYPALAIGAVSGKSSFAARIESILDPTRSRATRLSRSASAAIVTAAFVVAMAAPMVFARPTTHAHDPHENWVMRPYSKSVEIVNRKGNPVEGASAWLTVYGESAGKPIPLPVVGSTVQLSGGAAGVRSRGLLVVRAPRYAIGLSQAWPAPKQIEKVVLDDPHTISGEIILPGGAPGSGLAVHLGSLLKRNPDYGFVAALQLDQMADLNALATTDAEGRFAIDGIPGAAIATIDVDDDRFASIRNAVQFTTPVDGNNPSTAIYLKPAAQVSGIVTRDGKPVAHVRVGAQGSEGDDGWGEARTDALGRYTIKRLPAGTYNVELDIPEDLQGQVATAAHEAVSLEAGKTLDRLDFALVPGAVIEGRVLDGNDQPLPNVHVGIYGPAHPRSGGWVQPVLTDAQGHYRARVPGGKQYVYCEDVSANSSGVDVMVAPGSVTQLDIHAKDGPNPDGPAFDAPTSTAGEVVNHTADPDPNVKTDPIASFGAGKPFYGPMTLPNGATVRLAYVQDDVRGPHTPWAPSGSAAAAADVARSLNMTGFGARKNMDRPRSVFLRVDLSGVERGDTNCIVKVPHPSDWNVWQTYGDSEHKSMDMASFRAPTSLQQTDMMFGVGAGPYTSFLKSGLGTAPLFARASNGPVKPPDTLAEGDATVTVTVRFPAALEGKDVRLDAFDANGRRLPLASWQDGTQHDPKTGEATRSYGFSSAAVRDIARVDLTVRDYQWVTFKGIRLYPNSSQPSP